MAGFLPAISSRISFCPTATSFFLQPAFGRPLLADAPTQRLRELDDAAGGRLLLRRDSPAFSGIGLPARFWFDDVDRSGFVSVFELFKLETTLAAFGWSHARSGFWMPRRRWHAQDCALVQSASALTLPSVPARAEPVSSVPSNQTDRSAKGGIPFGGIPKVQNLDEGKILIGVLQANSKMTISGLLRTDCYDHDTIDLDQECHCRHVRCRSLPDRMLERCDLLFCC
ncbi:hypothetical protein [Bradyrhizobium archetypum]|uniref:EF-hand domain-containing protein n=1 Tax=Bradyrhizobium archetypum TaxID=2721160 RepID=A0A7Y4H4M1_9BRAD|nr:hypothetical protein [Bradyrhizobium archetypum]NOJ47571.1 hypothetical protein [Bradyrhizobium archetypum]